MFWSCYTAQRCSRHLCNVILRCFNYVETIMMFYIYIYCFAKQPPQFMLRLRSIGNVVRAFLRRSFASEKIREILSSFYLCFIIVMAFSWFINVCEPLPPGMVEHVRAVLSTVLRKHENSKVLCTFQHHPVPLSCQPYMLRWRYVIIKRDFLASFCEQNTLKVSFRTNFACVCAQFS